MCFSLKTEPSLVPLAGALMVAVGVTLAAMRWSRSRALVVLCVYAALFAGEITAGKIRTLRGAASIAPRSRSTVIAAWVTDVASAALGAGPAGDRAGEDRTPGAGSAAPERSG